MLFQELGVSVWEPSALGEDTARLEACGGGWEISTCLGLSGRKRFPSTTLEILVWRPHSKRYSIGGFVLWPLVNGNHHLPSLLRVLSVYEVPTLGTCRDGPLVRPSMVSSWHALQELSKPACRVCNAY